MKTKLIKRIKTEVYKENREKYIFFWTFTSDGVSSQKHDEADYSRFLDKNYISKSNIDLNLNY